MRLRLHQFSSLLKVNPEKVTSVVYVVPLSLTSETVIVETLSVQCVLSFRRQNCFVQEHLPPAYNSDNSSSLSPTLHTGTLFCFLHNGVHRGIPFFLHLHLRVQSLVIKTRPRLNRRPSIRQNFLGTGTQSCTWQEHPLSNSTSPLLLGRMPLGHFILEHNGVHDI